MTAEETSLAEGFAAIQEGRMDFDAFVRCTRPHWTRLSVHLRRQWDVPVWLAPEDIEQDMLFAAWSFLNRYDAKRGSTLCKFVVFNAVDKAKKTMHRARGANQHRNTERNPSRYERTESSFIREGEDEQSLSMETVAVAEPEQETLIERKEAAARAERACVTVPELLSVKALTKVGHSVTAAASLLYADRFARRVCQLTSFEKAQEVVEQAVREVASRMPYLTA